MSPDKLTYMANQIATFFATQPGDDRAKRVAAHINDFWPPTMRRQLTEKIATDGGTGLHDLVLEAADTVHPPAG
ncbi:formate dehydrogenase subunit delta [Marinibacterium profundimaris]|uniref:Formate dehydrogenase n=1 Tax=Marinibacterium profundimaris TaxID=1679460 RepID=A0A225NJG4_9RHOB|nr:formate dehydrogenase subunit delta [Marinibacterium profundimaris]OWU71630.1 formate dehydrogenase [Marinibacterium profundimaris]